MFDDRTDETLSIYDFRLFLQNKSGMILPVFHLFDLFLNIGWLVFVSDNLYEGFNHEHFCNTWSIFSNNWFPLFYPLALFKSLKLDQTSDIVLNIERFDQKPAVFVE